MTLIWLKIWAVCFGRQLDLHLCYNLSPYGQMSTPTLGHIFMLNQSISRLSKQSYHVATNLLMLWVDSPRLVDHKEAVDHHLVLLHSRTSHQNQDYVRCSPASSNRLGHMLHGLVPSPVLLALGCMGTRLSFSVVMQV